MGNQKELIVAIVGRPNVGKSTLVNRIVGHRQAIVDDMPGVTRDRTYHPVEWRGRSFLLVDTGGLIPNPEERFSELVNHQVEIALTEADVVVFVVDGIQGITPLDATVAARLRQLKKPVLLTVNKIDSIERVSHAAEFYALGLDAPRTLSALQGSGGVGDLLDDIVDAFPPADAKTEAPETPPLVRLAVVGRPNVGKSSLVNKLAQDDRLIVSDVPGTTRDAVDVSLSWQGQPYLLVDTAGIRKKGKVSYGVEMFSVDRSIQALRNADVTVLVLDATEGLTDQDRHMIKLSDEAGRGLLLVINKWDLWPDKDTKSTAAYQKKLLTQHPWLSHVPVVFISALTGQRIHKVLEVARTVWENNHRRISTGLLNQVLSEATALTPPPMTKGKQLKLLYGTQVKVSPPTFVLFVNDAKLLKSEYRRYLEKKLRASFEFSGTPLVLLLRSRETVSPRRSKSPPAQKPAEVSPVESPSTRRTSKRPSPARAAASRTSPSRPPSSRKVRSK